MWNALHALTTARLAPSAKANNLDKANLKAPVCPAAKENLRMSFIKIDMRVGICSNRADAFFVWGVDKS